MELWSYGVVIPSCNLSNLKTKMARCHQLKSLIYLAIKRGGVTSDELRVTSEEPADEVRKRALLVRSVVDGRRPSAGPSFIIPNS